MHLRRVLTTLALGLLVTSRLAADITLPELNPSEYFDGKMGGTFGAKTVTVFAKTNRVAVSGFRVISAVVVEEPGGV